MQNKKTGQETGPGPIFNKKRGQATFFKKRGQATFPEWTAPSIRKEEKAGETRGLSPFSQKVKNAAT